MSRSVALIGFMGSGKSTLGRALAERLEVRFVDLDDLVQTRAGCSVSEIFSQRGEQGFRIAEREALMDCVSQNSRMVLACGGGTPCQPGLLDILLGWGEVIFIDVPMEVLKTRTLPGRPLWGEGVDDLYHERMNVYRSAPIHLDGRLSPEVLVEAAVRGLELRG